MKTYTEKEFQCHLGQQIDDGNLDTSETDNDGQIIIYTNMYRWSDDTIRDTSERYHCGNGMLDGDDCPRKQ